MNEEVDIKEESISTHPLWMPLAIIGWTVVLVTIVNIILNRR